MLVIKLILIGSLGLIFYQDLKERAVWWFLFPLFIMTAGYLYYQQTLPQVFLQNIGLNLIGMTIVLGVSFLYAQFKMKVNFFRDAFGLGDLLFFLGIAIAFPSISFAVLFVFSLIFSLVLHFTVSRTKTQVNIPLAGYASLFLLFVYFSHWFGMYNNLYFI